MRYISLLFLLVATCAYAQDEDVVFTVNKRQAVISLQPNVDTLYNCMAYSFAISGIDVKSIDSVSYGRAKVKLDDVLHISNVSMYDTVLRLYASRRGVMQEVFSKKLVVVYCRDEEPRSKLRPNKPIVKIRSTQQQKRNRRTTPSSLTTITNRQR